MNQKFSKEFSYKITNEQIDNMLNEAKKGITDWTKASVANKGISRGTHWNMFCKNFNVEKEYHPVLKYRMIQEYGCFLPNELKPIKKTRTKKNKPLHQKPIF